MQLQEKNRSLKHVIYSENKVPFLFFQSTYCQQTKSSGSNKVGNSTVTRVTFLSIGDTKISFINHILLFSNPSFVCC